MFEILLENILQKYLGGYFKNLDTAKLSVGVWNGKIVFENLSLSNLFFSKYSLPFKILYSNVSKLLINIPWNKLSSCPVEIFLEGIDILLSTKNVCACEESSDKMRCKKCDNETEDEENAFFLKIDQLENFVENYRSTLLRQKSIVVEGEKMKEKSFIQSLTLKILDNLQISIKNINIRIIDNLPKDNEVFCLDIKLDYLDIYNTDASNSKTFIDRSKTKEGLHKLFNLKNFDIYWKITLDKDFTAEKSVEDFLRTIDRKEKQESPKSPKKQSYFYFFKRADTNIEENACEIPENTRTNKESEKEKESKRIISFTCQIQLFHRNKLTKDEEFEMKSDMGKIEINLEKEFLEKILRILELIALYRKRQKKKRVEQVNDKSNNEENFKEFYFLIMKSKEKTLLSLPLKDQINYSNILNVVPIENLCEWSKPVIQKICKEEHEEQEKRKGSWSGWFWNKSNLLNEEEEKKMEAFFEEYEFNYSSKKKSYESIRYLFNFNLEGGELVLRNEKEKSIYSAFISYEGLNGIMVFSKLVKNFQLTLQQFRIDLISNFKTKMQKNFNILQNREKLHANEPLVRLSLGNVEIPNSLKIRKVSSLIQFHSPSKTLQEFDVQYQEHDSLRKEEIFSDNPQPYTFNLRISGSTIVYSPIFFNTILKFFKLKIENKEIKGDALETYHELGNKTQETIKENMFDLNKLKINVFLDCPIIKIPFVASPEVWTINLGVLQIQSRNVKNPKFNLPKQSFKLNLKNVKMDYESKNEKEKFTLLDDFEIKIYLSMLSRKEKEINKNHPKISIQIKIPSFRLAASKKIFNKLFLIQSALFWEDLIDSEEDEKKTILENSKKVGKVFKRGLFGLNIWKEYFAVISDNYLYFFVHQNDLAPDSYFYIKNCKIDDSAIASFENAFKVIHEKNILKGVCLIESLSGTLFLNTEKSSDKISWIEALRKYSKNNSGNITNRAISSESKENLPIVSMNLEIYSVTVLLLCDFNRRVEGRLNKLNVIYQKNVSSSYIESNLNSIEINEINDEKQFNILKSQFYLFEEETNKNKKELIQLEIKNINENCSLYKNIDMKIYFYLGTLELNYNRDTFLTIIDFVERKKVIFERNAPRKEEKNNDGMQESLNAISNGNNSSQKFLDKNPNKFENAQPCQPLSSFEEKIKKNKNRICFALVIQKISSTFFNKKANKPFFEVKLKKTELKFYQTDFGQYLFGRLGNLQIIDLSEYKNGPKEMEILGLQNEMDSLFTIKIEKENKNSSIKCQLSAVKLNLVLQQMKRIFLYCLHQILDKIKLKSAVSTQGVVSVSDISEPEDLQKFYFEIEEPFIILKPSFLDKEYFVFNLGKIIIQNFVESKRNTKTASITMENMNIKQIKEDAAIERTQNFDLSINLISTKDSKSSAIYFFVKPIIIFIDNNFVRLMNEILKENILFDDGKFEFYDIEESISHEPSKEHKLNREIHAEFENIALFFFDSSSLYKHPFCNLIFFNLKIFLKINDRNLYLNFVAKSLDSSIYIVKNDVLIEETLIGLQQKERIYDRNKMDFEKEILWELNSHSKNDLSTNKLFILEWKGSETNDEINIDLQKLHLNVHLEVLEGFKQLISGFNLNLRKNSLPSSETTQKKGFILAMKIINPLIALKCHKEKYRLIATGDIHFYVSSSPFKNILEETLLNYSKINLIKIEVFICTLDDFTRKQFIETQKRKIITPFSIEITKEKILRPFPAKEQDSLDMDRKDFSLRKRITIEGGDFYAFISYQDVLLLQKTLQTKIKSLNIRSSNYQISPELIDTLVSTHGNSIRLVFINDFDRSYTPLIDLNLNQLHSLINISLSRFNLTISIEKLNSNYFNFLVNRWEPFVENLALLMDLTNEEKCIKINVEQKITDNPVNFNMSNQMINLLTKAFINIKNDLKKEEKQKVDKITDNKDSFLANSSQTFENSAYFENYKRQKISFYSIRNSTGYNLEITDEENDNRRVVERNFTINYFFESDSEVLYSDKRAKNKKINIFFTNSLIKLQPLVGLDLDHLRIKQYRIYQYKNPLAFFHILGKLELHPETNRKLLTLYSSYSIWNQLDRAIQLKFALNANEIKEEPIFTLASGEIMDLPIDLTNSSFRLKTQDSKIWSELLNSFKNLMLNSITIGEFKINMIEEKNSENLKTTFTIHPLCKIINLLPVKLNLNVFFNNKVLSKEIILLERESYYLYQDNFSGFSIAIEKFLRSDMIEIKDLKFSEKLSKFDKESKRVIALKNERESFIEINFIQMIKENRIFLMITPIKYIVNFTKLPLMFYQAGSFSDREYPLIDNNKAFLNDCKQVLIFENEIDLRSKMNYSIKINQHEYDISVENIDLTYENVQFASMVTINPQYIFLSQLDEEIIIREIDQREEAKLTKKDPVHFYWKKTRHFQIKKDDSDWSGTLLITSQNFLLRSTKGYSFLRTTLDGPYLVFQMTPPPFLLINNLSEINIHYNQKDIPTKNEILKSYEHTFFGWDEPTLFPELHLTFIKKKKIVGAGIINLGIITPEQVMSFENGDVFYKCEVGDETISFFFESFISDKENPENPEGRDVPLLNLNEKFIENRKKKTESAMNLRIYLKITNLGISFINNLNIPFCEIGYFSMKELEIAYWRENDENETVHIKLSNAELDNNTSFWTNYPIVFIAKFNEKNFKQPLLTVLIKKKITKQKIHILERLLIDFQDFQLNIEEKFLKNIKFYINNIYSQIKSTKSKEEEINLLHRHHVDPFCTVNYHLKSPVKTKVFIEEFSIYPFTIYFGYKTQVVKGKDAGKMFGNLFNTVLKNMDNVPIKLQGYEIKYYNDNLSSFLPLILKVFKEKMKSEVLQIIGSAPLIGDPRGFFLNVSNGVKDLIEKPQQGLIKGRPLEAGVGLIEGVSSLMANTLVGTINSIDKFSNSIGSGIAALSQDEEFLIEREKLRISRPENLLQGIQQAGESIYKSIGLGFTKIFTSPISGAQKSGISGFIKGAFSGLTGLFLHPITGIVDGASKTAEGLKNTVSFKTGEGRARKIRVFYDFEQYFTPYNEEDSSMMEYLRIYKKGKFENLSFKKGVMLENESCLLIFTMQKTLLMKTKNGKKVWSFNNEDIDTMENYSDGVRIGLKKKMKETDEYHIFIPASSEVKQMEISQTLNEIAFNLKEKQ